MLIFGAHPTEQFENCRYFLRSIKDENQIDHDYEELSKLPLSLRNYLSKPTGSILNIAKSILFRTGLELLDFHQYFNKFSKKISKLKSDRINKIVCYENGHYVVDLVTFWQRGSEPYWVKLLAEDNLTEVANVQIKRGAISIFTHQPIIIEGAVQLSELKIFSKNAVYITNELNISTNLLVYADTFIADDKTEINTTNVSFNCTQYCELNGIVLANSLQIKAGKFHQNGTLEAQESIHIITEDCYQNGYIKARKSITSISLNYINTEKSKLHSPGRIHILSDEFKDEGVISTNYFNLHALTTYFNGRTFSATETVIEGSRFLGTSPEAKFFLNGRVYQCSQWSAIFKGRMTYQPDLKIAWQTSTNPELDVMLRSLNRDDTNTEILEKKYEIKPQSQVHLHADFYLEMSGELKIDQAQLMLSSHQEMIVSGLVWQSSFFEEYGINLQTNSLAIAGSIQTDSVVQAKVERDLVQTGGINCNKAIISAENFLLKQNAILHADQFHLRVKDTIFTEEKSRLEIQKQAALFCKYFKHDGAIENRGTLLIEAERMIYKRGPIRGGHQHYVAPLIICIGDLQADSLSITAYLSFIAGLNRCEIYNNNSLINFSPLLTLQSLIFPRDISSFLLTVLNIGFTVVNLSMPGAQAIILPIQIGINSLTRLTSAYYMTNSLLQNIKNISHDPSSTDVLQVVTSINLIAMSVLSSVISGYSSYQVLHSPLPTFHQPDPWSLAQRIVPYTFSLISGQTDSSFIKIDPGIFIGSSLNSFHLFSIKPPSHIMFGILNSDNSVFSIDAGIQYTILSSNKSGLFSYNASYVDVLYGQYNLSCYNDLIIRPLYSSQHSHWNVQADRLRIDGPVTFYNSSLDVNFLENNSDLHLDHSTAEISMLNNHSNTEFYYSSVKSKTVKNERRLLFVGSEVKMDTVDNKSGMQTVLSNVDINNLSINPESFFAIDISHVDINNINIAGNLQIRSSDVNIGRVKNTGNVQITDSTVKGLKLSEKRHARNSHSRENLRLFTAGFNGNIVSYSSASPLFIQKTSIFSLIPIAYRAPNITMQGPITVTQDFYLQADNHVLIRGALHVEGSIYIDGEKGVSSHADITTLVKKHLKISFHGILYKKTKDEVATPAQIIATKKIVVHSRHGDIYFNGTNIHAQSVECIAQNVSFLSTMLNHKIHLIEAGINITLPALQNIFFNPNILTSMDISFDVGVNRFHYQTLVPGMMIADHEVNIKAEENIKFENNFSIRANKTNFQAKHVELKRAVLSSSVKKFHCSAGAEVSPTGVGSIHITVGKTNLTIPIPNRRMFHEFKTNHHNILSIRESKMMPQQKIHPVDVLTSVKSNLKKNLPPSYLQSIFHWNEKLLAEAKFAETNSFENPYFKRIAVDVGNVILDPILLSQDLMVMTEYTNGPRFLPPPLNIYALYRSTVGNFITQDMYHQSTERILRRGNDLANLAVTTASGAFASAVYLADKTSDPVTHFIGHGLKRSRVYSAASERLRNRWRNTQSFFHSLSGPKKAGLIAELSTSILLPPIFQMGKIGLHYQHHDALEELGLFAVKPKEEILHSLLFFSSSPLSTEETTSDSNLRPSY